MAYTTIDDPSAYFHTQLYTGTGSSNAITNNGNSDLQPDFIWLKDRSATNGHAIQDTSRGITNVLFTNGNDYENQYTNTVVDSVQSDGFTVSTNANSNTNTNNYVAWQWKANGGTTASNTDGSITSTVQANTTAGFSIVTYTGTGSTATVGHGLGSTPDMLIFKKRSAADNWYVYHSANTSAPETDYLVLDTIDATTDFNIWNNTAPTSSVFSISNAGVHADGQTMVCYAFAEKQGYSKFGSYTGNGNADGPFVYTGFKPRWLMIKGASNLSSWNMYDTKRSPFNDSKLDAFKANTTDAETSSPNNEGGDNLDILSNGFKILTTDGDFNGNGNSYIYMAFAESPFVSSEGAPTTAR